MKTEWLSKKSSDTLLLFYNGWGMDKNVLNHFNFDCDVLMFYDYRSLSVGDLPDFSAYTTIRLLAWSMGVWAAANTLHLFDVEPEYAVAVNGSELPVDDSFGIPEKIYLLTEKGMDNRGRDKFLSRMFDSVEDRERFFTDNMPARELSEQIEELTQIRIASALNHNSIHWDKALISVNDRIFPSENLFNYWNEKTNVITLQSGHYPFFVLKNMIFSENIPKLLCF
ncbi:MAG: DUF452 family protein [Culturomica sp.]|jgi:biotin synthesis protein BioG|nr:DUF452 family protein [Culturomica sp.]